MTSHYMKTTRVLVRLVVLWAMAALLPLAPAQTADQPPAKQIKIVLVGDSTVTDKSGWGLGFKQFITEHIDCVNTAAGGRSSKSFINEGRWAKALEAKGDYYLIQFGHNDEPGKGPDRETDPATTYTQNMARYVDEARAIGAKPVLVTSLTRRQWNANGDGKITSSLVPYVEAVKKLAADKHVPLIDLHASSKELCEQLGREKCNELSPIKGTNEVDNTHLNAKGSVVFARLVVTGLEQAVPELTPYFRTEPVAAEKVFDVKKFGAVGDGQSLDTVAIQKALDACAQAGGGIVEFSKGTYLSQPIYLKGNGLTVQLDAGATLLASTNFADFADPQKPGAVVAFVNAKGLNDLTLRGSGVIDGQGAVWWPAVRQAKKDAAPEPRRRPRLVVLQNCLNLHIMGITLQNSPSFHLVPVDSEDVTIDGIKILAPADSPNTDAMDPSVCRHVQIRNCTFDVGDDNIALKSGRVDAAHPDAAVEDVLVENCTFLHGHGMSIGSETLGGVKKLVVRNCTFDGTTSGIRIKSDRTRGGLVQNCRYENLTMKNVKIPVNITMYYPKVPATDTEQPVTEKTPRYRDLKIVNLKAESPQSAGFVVGLPESCVTNITFENIAITAPKGLTLRNAHAVNFDHATIQVTGGKPLILETNAEVTGWQ
jgi:polygalacturonase